MNKVVPFPSIPKPSLQRQNVYPWPKAKREIKRRVRFHHLRRHWNSLSRDDRQMAVYLIVAGLISLVVIVLAPLP